MGKKPACPKFGMRTHLYLKGNQIWTAGIRVPGSMVHIGFRSPPAFLPLSRGGGGGPESGMHLSDRID
jgi:hypothetical protein